MLRGLKAESNDRGDAATVAGRMAARKALSALLAQAPPENRASLLEYVEERAAALRLHAQRQGAVPSFAPASARGGHASGRRNASVRPATSEVRREAFSCRYPGQLFGIVGHSDVLDGGTGTARARSASKVEELGVTAIGACGVGNYVPTCNPEFFTTTSSSPSSATIMGVSATYLAGLGCAISGSQTATLVNGGRVREQFIPVDPCPPLPPLPPGPPPNFTVSGPQSAIDGGSANFAIQVLSGTPTWYLWAFTYPAGAGNNPSVSFSPNNQASTTTNAHWFALPDSTCGAGTASTYTITASVGWTNAPVGQKTTSLQVYLPPTMGYVDPGEADVTGQPVTSFDEVNQVFTVYSMGNLARKVPTAHINVPSSSQFYSKTVAHEQVHVTQWQSGLFSDLFVPADFYNQIKGLTDPTLQGLVDQIASARAAYRYSQLLAANSRLATAEQQAYAVSDLIAPQYLYQASCSPAGL